MNNLERQKQASFINTIFIIGACIVVKRGSDVRSWADLKGKNVMTTAGMTSERLLRKIGDEKQMGTNIIGVKGHDQSFLTLESSRVVTFMMDNALLYGERVKVKSPAEWVVMAKSQSHETYGCVVHKDDKSSKALTDKTIAGMMRDGTINIEYKKWFERPVPPEDVNMKFPLSNDVRALTKNLNDEALD